MSDELKPCMECGMVYNSTEYHPYAACLMFKSCHNSEVVRANLDFVLNSKPLTIPATGPVTENDILEIIAENERMEQITKDACRYRLLKGVALQKGALEATIAMAQLDFISDPEKFDAVVDGLEQK